MNLKPLPNNKGKKAIALFFAWLLIAAACGDDLPDATVTGDPSEETDDDATGEEPEEPVAGEAEEEAAEAGAEEEEAEAITTNYTCVPTHDPDPLPNALYSAMPTNCDAAAGRNIAGTAERATHNEVFLEQKRAAYPDTVVANPAECLNPGPDPDGDPNSEPGADLDSDALPVLDSDAAADFYAMFVAGQILTVHDFDTFKTAVSAVDDSLFVELLDQTPAPELDGLLTTIGYENLGRDADGVLQLSRILVDGIPELDALELSNLLLSAGYYARPNYVLALAPGSQHSPANEPVPAHVDDVERIETGLDYSQLTVAVLDSDWNFSAGQDGQHDSAAAGEMRLWAGHMTFVSGVVDLLAPGVSVEQEEFEAGEQISDAIDEHGPFLSDFTLLKRFDPSNDTFLSSLSYSALNLSAGAYTCPLPEGVGGDQIQESPPGILSVVTRIQEKQNIVVVAAAGNDGLPAEELRRFWPAGLADSGQFDETLIAVRAHDINGAEADFSNKFPANAVCALGVDVRSAYPTGDYLYSDLSSLGRFEGAAIWSGTSFATPMITSEYVNLRAGGENRSADEAMDHMDAIATIRANHSC